MVNLSTISHIWNIIVKSNTFNFVIFVLILAWIAKKIDVPGVISALQQKIIKIIDEVKKAHEEAKGDLSNANKAIENLETELATIVEEASNSAKVIGEKILSEAQKQIESIESNTTKVIEAEEKLLVSKLTKNTSLASIEAAKSNIKEALYQTPTLHEKYINECIEELDRLSF